MSLKGKNIKLYISTAFESPAHLEVKRSGDIDLGFDKDSEEYMFRGGQFAYNSTGPKKAPITFKYLRSKPAVAGSGETAAVDTVYAALLDSFVNDTPLFTHVSRRCDHDRRLKRLERSVRGQEIHRRHRFPALKPGRRDGAGRVLIHERHNPSRRRGRANYDCGTIIDAGELNLSNT